MVIRSKRSSPTVVEIESLCALVERGASLSGAVVQGVDLRPAEIDWRQTELEGTVFLGCRFRSLEQEIEVRRRGAVVFPRLEGVPYDPYRSSLYTWQELMGQELMGQELTASSAGATANDVETLDYRIYRHFEEQGRHLASITEELAQRIHDHAIDDAVHDYLDFSPEGLPRRAAVGIMGGHGEPRGSEDYRRVAATARLLSREGYLVVTGGGPGVMEAGNLGAYLAQLDERALEAAVDHLVAAPTFRDPGYLELALELVERHPGGGESLAVPTWFYGHEPSNLFASAIAKYFSNSIREDGLLAICLYGIVFAPGSAGTTQEVFQDYGQNHYRTFGYQSPMVFLEGRGDPNRCGIFELLSQIAREAENEHLLLQTDSPREAVRFLRERPPFRDPSR